ncbi:MAG TPA: substrate-binding domain-containing protein, partial [Thermomicrobiales bacterium]|nr:substrate-binding domain-containing protein [Thermomicrobiales bacterium]
LLDQDLDGIILVGAFTEADIQTLIPSLACPLVVVDGPGPSMRHDAVTSNNVAGAMMATEHLIAAGHSQIGFITRPGHHNPNFQARERGYRAAMAANELSPAVAEIAGWNVAAAVNALMDRVPGLTALACVNDQFALDAFHTLEQRGMTVPHDISLIGFDNTDHATAMRPGLTTMHVDKVSMGRFAITLLDQRLQWPDAAPATVVLAPRIVTRGSVGPPRSS